MSNYTVTVTRTPVTKNYCARVNDTETGDLVMTCTPTMSIHKAMRDCADAIEKLEYQHYRKGEN